MRFQDIVIVANSVRSELARAGRQNGFPVPIDNVLWYVNDVLNIRVQQFIKTPALGEHLQGVLMRYEAGAKKFANIWLADSLNNCWTRFVACKELSHLMLDRGDDYTVDPFKLIDQLISVLPDSIEAPLLSEYTAYFLATELLLPWGQRQSVDAMIAAGSSTYDIAVRFGVPAKAVENWCGERYRKIATEAWEDIH